jgi:hypothetical protein
VLRGTNAKTIAASQQVLNMTILIELMEYITQLKANSWQSKEIYITSALSAISAVINLN